MSIFARTFAQAVSVMAVRAVDLALHIDLRLEQRGWMVSRER
jgi:hypothetical protein